MLEGIIGKILSILGLGPQAYENQIFLLHYPTKDLHRSVKVGVTIFTMKEKSSCSSGELDPILLFDP